MDYRRLGNSGLKLSVLSLGSWVTFHNQVDRKAAREMMALAHDRGVNFFDNAEAYAHGHSEEVMGAALQELAWPRDSFCVSSKVFWGGELPTQRGLSRKHVTEACHAALRRLQVDYLDLYFCHRPDPETPVVETVRAMHDLVAQGKVLYWGTSEWSAAQITEAFEAADRHHLTPPTMEQPEYNLFNRARMECEYPVLFERYGLGTTIWSPLASGVLTGKYRSGVPADSRLALPSMAWLRERMESTEGRARIDQAGRLEDLARNRGMPLHHLALRWCLANPNVSTVILGASRVEQLEDNLRSVEGEYSLDEDLLAGIGEIVGGGEGT